MHSHSLRLRFSRAVGAVICRRSHHPLYPVAVVSAGQLSQAQGLVSESLQKPCSIPSPLLPSLLEVNGPYVFASSQLRF